MTVSDALNSAAAYRALLLAALDELHAAALRERRLREQLQEQREFQRDRRNVLLFMAWLTSQASDAQQQRDAWARLSTERLVNGA